MNLKRILPPSTNNSTVDAINTGRMKSLRKDELIRKKSKDHMMATDLLKTVYHFVIARRRSAEYFECDFLPTGIVVKHRLQDSNVSIAALVPPDTLDSLFQMSLNSPMLAEYLPLFSILS